MCGLATTEVDVAWTPHGHSFLGQFMYFSQRWIHPPRLLHGMLSTNNTLPCTSSIIMTISLHNLPNGQNSMHPNPWFQMPQMKIGFWMDKQWTCTHDACLVGTKTCVENVFCKNDIWNFVHIHFSSSSSSFKIIMIYLFIYQLGILDILQ